MPSWESIPEDEKPFQRRLMEVAAGFTEHVDVQVGRLINEIDKLGYAQAIIRSSFTFGAITGPQRSGQGRHDQRTPGAKRHSQHHQAAHQDALDELGGLRQVLGSPKVDNQYHAGWALGREYPLQGNASAKLLASYFGGTRNPMAKYGGRRRVKPDATPRPQFHHCNDVVPTIYEVLGIHTTAGGQRHSSQDPIDGVSFAYSFDDPKAKGQLLTQYFEIMGSRSLYHDGWMALGFRTAHPMGSGLGRQVFTSGHRTRTCGNSITSRTTGPRPTTWRPRCRRSWLN